MSIIIESLFLIELWERGKRWEIHWDVGFKKPRPILLQLSVTSIPMLWRNIIHCTKMHEIKPKHAPMETTYNFWLFTSSSLLSFFLLSCFAFGSKFGGNAFTKPAAVSAILWIWASTRTGVSWRGEVDMHG